MNPTPDNQEQAVNKCSQCGAILPTAETINLRVEMAGAEAGHVPECAWQQTTSAECEYRDTHHYCPHPEHACDCADYNMTVEQAEAILQAHGTSSEEVVNGFIEQLLRERQEAIDSLTSRDTEVREVLEGLTTRRWFGDKPTACWCDPRAYPDSDEDEDQDKRCQQARRLYAKLQPKESNDAT